MGYTYPTTPLPDAGYTSGEVYGVSELPYPSGRTCRVKTRKYGLLVARMRYSVATEANIATIMTLRANVGGPFGRFTFVDFSNWDGSPAGLAWTNLFVGIGTGSQTVFDLPLASTYNPYLYVDGTLKYNPTHYSLGSGTGTDGRDKVTFVTAPALNSVITISATGKRTVYARFASEPMLPARYAAGIVSLDVSIVEEPS